MSRTKERPTLLDDPVYAALARKREALAKRRPEAVELLRTVERGHASGGSVAPSARAADVAGRVATLTGEPVAPAGTLAAAEAARRDLEAIGAAIERLDRELIDRRRQIVSPIEKRFLDEARELHKETERALRRLIDTAANWAELTHWARSNGYRQAASPFARAPLSLALRHAVGFIRITQGRAATRARKGS